MDGTAIGIALSTICTKSSAVWLAWGFGQMGGFAKVCIRMARRNKQSLAFFASLSASLTRRSAVARSAAKETAHRSASTFEASSKASKGLMQVSHAWHACRRRSPSSTTESLAWAAFVSTPSRRARSMRAMASTWSLFSFDVSRASSAAPTAASTRVTASSMLRSTEREVPNRRNELVNAIWGFGEASLPRAFSRASIEASLSLVDRACSTREIQLLQTRLCCWAPNGCTMNEQDEHTPLSQ
mmetsp:Transcript_71737/g.201281  ORF Transcript_71737/g.201281 Transcript_71737/m.201281 type:complete len:242 (+) Transcript_71737:1019-1744(+)